MIYIFQGMVMIPASPALLKHPAAKLPANAISESWSAMRARIPLEIPGFSRKMIRKWRMFILFYVNLLEGVHIM